MNNSLIKITATFVFTAFIAACGGREARPVASTSLQDSQLDCAAITREFNVNEQRILTTLKEKDDGVAKNIVLGVTGVVLFFPALFFMDPKSPERVEIQALRSRNRVLQEMAQTKKSCVLESKLQLVYQRLDS